MTLPVPAIQPQAQLPAAMQAPQAPFAPMGLGVTQEQKLELLEYWRTIVKRKRSILALAGVVGMLAAVVAYALPQIFRATATVLIESGKVKVLSIEDVYSGGQQRENYQTQVEILKTREVAERTAAALKLWEQPEFDPRGATPSLKDRLMAVLGMKEIQTDWSEDELKDAATAAIQLGLTVEPVRLSQLIKVSFDARSPALAAKVANTLVQQYVLTDKDARFGLSQQASDFLQQNIAALKEKMEEAEQALQNYREKKGIVVINGSAQVLAGQQLGNTTERLVQARSRRAELESSFELAKTAQGVELSEIPAVLRDPAIADIRAKYAEAKRKLLTLKETLGSQNYRLQQAQIEFDEAEKMLIAQSKAVVAGLRLEYAAATATVATLSKALSAAESDVRDVNRDEFQLAVLEREAASNRSLYEMFLSRAKETDLARDAQGAVARVVDSAVPLGAPIRPAKVRMVVIATILALFAGAAAALTMDRLDNTLKGGDDAEQRLHLPVLTALPMVPDHDRATMTRIFLDENHSHYAEGIRTARTGVLLSSLDVPHKILLVTSTLPGEGKTTVAVNLALAHAQTKRTLLIDADMRRAQAGRALGLGTPGQLGMTNLVSGDAAAADCIHPVKDSKLLVLPVGDMPPNPLELLLSQRFKDVLAQLSADYEMIIIDSPPVELVSEALVLAPMATSVAFVVKAMSTPAPLARKSIVRIERTGGKILGVIVNQLDFARAQRYYGEYGGSSYSYGGYGYGGTYGETPKLAGDAGDAGDKKKSRLAPDTIT